MRHGMLRAVTLALAGAPAAAGLAGTVVESTTTDVRTGKPVETRAVSAQGPNLRLERRSALDASDRSLLLYAGERLYVVDDRTRAFRVMDRTSLQAVEAARAAEAERIGADRARRQARRAAARTVAAPLPTLVDTGRTAHVGPWTCRTWNEVVKGRTVAEHCVASLAALGGTDLGPALKSFSAFWRQVAADYPGLRDTGGALAETYARTRGLPVQTRTFVGGRPQEITVVTRVRQEPLGNAMFQVPAGYEQQNMMREANAR